MRQRCTGTARRQSMWSWLSFLRNYQQPKQRFRQQYIKGCLHHMADVLKNPCPAYRAASWARYPSKQPADNGQQVGAILAAGCLLVACRHRGPHLYCLTCDIKGYAPRALEQPASSPVPEAVRANTSPTAIWAIRPTKAACSRAMPARCCSACSTAAMLPTTA